MNNHGPEAVHDDRGPPHAGYSTGSARLDNRFDVLQRGGILRRGIHSSLTVGAVILVAYGLWLFSLFHSGQQPRDLIHISPDLLNQSHASSVIKADPNYPTVNANGYDGQFFYYLALDPVNARYYMDASTYRYTRILYPMVARALALGRADLIPITLFLVNWLALAGGTAAVAAWLKRRGVSPWFGLIYGLYPGLQFALARDLSEALAYGLVALAILVFDFGGRHRLVLSATVFALATLTRESTAVFSVAYGLALLLGAAQPGPWRPRLAKNWRTAVLFLAIALLPFAAYKIYLLAWLGAGHDAGIPFARLPFQGLWQWRYWETPPLMEQIRSVVIPGLIAGAAAAVALVKRVRRVEVWLLLANVVLFVIFLQAAAYADYSASGRVTAGVVLSALLCLPWIATPGRRGWFWASSVLWLSLTPFWLVFPTLHYFLHVLR